MAHSEWNSGSAFSKKAGNLVDGNIQGAGQVKERPIVQWEIQEGRGVKGLIIDGDRVLVLEKPDGKPDLAGGRVEPGETLLEALPREIEEETRCRAKILGPIFEWSFWKNPHFLIKGATFLCRYLGGKIRISDEHAGFKWVRIGELFALDWERPYFG
jgi:8-oxo-dGTP diphosphatase